MNPGGLGTRPDFHASTFQPSPNQIGQLARVECRFLYPEDTFNEPTVKQSGNPGGGLSNWGPDAPAKMLELRPVYFGELTTNGVILFKACVDTLTELAQETAVVFAASQTSQQAAWVVIPLMDPGLVAVAGPVEQALLPLHQQHAESPGRQVAGDHRAKKSTANDGHITDRCQLRRNHICQSLLPPCQAGKTPCFSYLLG